MTDEERKKMLSIIGDALVRSLQSLTWAAWTILAISSVLPSSKRRRKLLKTQYSEQVASQAQLLAPRMKLQERR
jgi:hypothetical protein